MTLTSPSLVSSIADSRGPATKHRLYDLASGDLRNIVKTINRLPDNFAGKLTVILNDRDPHVSLRNILLLKLLGTDESDSRRSADIALHLWYSAFMPLEYRAEIIQHASSIVMGEDGSQTNCLGLRSTLNAVVDKDFKQLAGLYCLSTRAYDAGDATNELARVRYALYPAIFKHIPV